MCSHDWGKKNILGNLKKEKFLDIWLCKKSEEARNKLNNSDRSLSPCNVCDVTGDLNRRRGLLEGMDTRAGAQIIKAKVPLSEMFGYVTQLRSLSSGRASNVMEFSHYAPAPNNVAEEVIAKVKNIL